MGKQIFVPSMVSDKVVAYDTDTGRAELAILLRWAGAFCAGRLAGPGVLRQ